MTYEDVRLLNVVQFKADFIVVIRSIKILNTLFIAIIIKMIYVS